MEPPPISLCFPLAVHIAGRPGDEAAGDRGCDGDTIGTERRKKEQAAAIPIVLACLTAAAPETWEIS